MAAEGGPEGQKRGDGPAGEAAPSCGEHGADDQRDRGVAQERGAEGLAIGLPGHRAAPREKAARACAFTQATPTTPRGLHVVEAEL